MAERSLFFNAMEIKPDVFDREYQAQDFAEYFGSVLSTGLLHTDKIPSIRVSVEAGTLNTIISPGKAIMKGHLYENTTPLTLAHSLPEVSLDRIDRVVLRLNLHNAERNILLHVKEGVAASNPIAPALQRDDFIHEISLAQIRVRKNTAQLLPSDITDERLDTNLCGLASSMLDIPTDLLNDLLQQRTDEVNVASANFQAELLQMITDYQNEWQTWFDGIKDKKFATEEDLVTHELDGTAHGIGSEDLKTTAKTVKGAINEVFTTGNNVKRDTVNALLSIDDSLPITSDSAWIDVIESIGQVSAGKKWAEMTVQGAIGQKVVMFDGLDFTPSYALYYSSIRSKTWNTLIGVAVKEGITQGNRDSLNPNYALGLSNLSARFTAASATLDTFKNNSVEIVVPVNDNGTAFSGEFTIMVFE